MPTNALESTYLGIISPLQELWNSFASVVPNLIGALIVLIIGAFVAVILGHAVRVILDKTKLDSALRKAKLTKAIGHTDVPALLGELVQWWILIIFLQASVEILELGSLTVLLGQFVSWLPKLLVAVIIMLLGLASAHYVEAKIQEHTKMKGMKMSALVVKWIIVVLVSLVALDLIGLDVGLLNNAVLIIIGALGVGIALALGISMGLALRKDADGFIKDVRKNL